MMLCQRLRLVERTGLPVEKELVKRFPVVVEPPSVLVGVLHEPAFERHSAGGDVVLSDLAHDAVDSMVPEEVIADGAHCFAHVAVACHLRREDISECWKDVFMDIFGVGDLDGSDHFVGTLEGDGVLGLVRYTIAKVDHGPGIGKVFERLHPGPVGSVMVTSEREHVRRIVIGHSSEHETLGLDGSYMCVRYHV